MRTPLPRTAIWDPCAGVAPDLRTESPVWHSGVCAWPPSGVPVPSPVPLTGVHPLRSHLPIPGVAADLQVRIHHPLREPLDHLPEQVRARRLQRVLEPGAGNRHNVTFGPLVSPSSRNEPFEGSRSGRLRSRRHAQHRQISHSRISYPIHHSRGRELTLPARHSHLCPQCLLPINRAAVTPRISNRIKQSHPAAALVVGLTYLQADAVRCDLDREGV